MNRETKINAIYKKIADKTLSFGCKIETIYKNSSPSKTNKYIFCYEKKFTSAVVKQENNKKGYEIEKNYNELNNVKIIGHPIMIGDVLDYIRKKIASNVNATDYINTIFFWRELRKPLDIQSDECIDYIYNLIK